MAKHGEGQGAIAAAELVRYMEPPNVPVFYLTDDKEAYERVRKANPQIDVKQLNVSGLYDALSKEDLLPLAGFQNIPFQQVFTYTNDCLREQGFERNTSPFYTRIAQDVSPHIMSNGPTPMPFRASLRGLKAEIEQKKAAQTVVDNDTTGLNKFAKRFGSLGSNRNRAASGAENQK